MVIYGNPAFRIDTDLTEVASVGFASMLFKLYAVTDPSKTLVLLQTGGESKGMLIRPLYDIDNNVPPATHRTMTIPSYVFSNTNDEVTCRGFVSPFPTESNNRIYTTSTVSFTPSYSCTGAMPVLPDVSWANTHRLQFNDTRPDTYCVKGEKEQASEVDTIHPHSNVINATIPEEVSFPYMYTYRDVLMISLDKIAGGKTEVRLTGKTVGGTEYAVRNPSECKATGMWSGHTESNFQSPIYSQYAAASSAAFLKEPIRVECKDLQIYTKSGPTYTEFDTFTFGHTTQIMDAWYPRILEAINNNEHGWGTGTINGGTEQFTIMGMPFLTLLGTITAYVAFQRRHLPAAIILYISIISAMKYFEIISWSETTIGILITIGLFGLFQKVFRK